MLMKVDPRLHFHVLPRYGSPRKFGGVEWSDPGRPNSPGLSGGVPAIDAITDVLRKAARL